MARLRSRTGLLGPVARTGLRGRNPRLHTVHHFAIDSRLGDQEDFDHLVAEAARRGLRIVLDGVFNHVGRSFPAFQAALAGGPGAPAARWFRRDAVTGEYAFADFEGHTSSSPWTTKSPRSSTMWPRSWPTGWTGARRDGDWTPRTRCRPFWAKVLPGIRESHPDAWFVGEMIHGDYAAYAADSGLESITQYELWKAIWSSLNDRNFFELAWALDRHNQVLDSVMPQTFTGNHDVTRLASQLTDERHFGHALAVLLTVGGIPSIYYGDERGFRGVKEDRAGGDDEIRPAYPASPAELPPDGWPVYRLHQRLVGFRRRHPWLVRARTTVEHLTNETIAFRAAGDDAGILVLLNAGDTSFRFPVDVAGLAVAEAPDPGARPDDPAQVPAHSWVILSP